jgi:hypothetical protein
VWCLLKETYKPRNVLLKTGNGKVTVELEAHQFIFGRNTVARELNIPGSNVWKWLKRFGSGEYILTQISPNRQYSIITIYQLYDYRFNEDASVTANEQPKISRKDIENQSISEKDIPLTEHKQEELLFLYNRENINTYNKEASEILKNTIYDDFKNAAARAQKIN